LAAIGVVATAPAVAALEPLLAAYRRRGWAVDVVPPPPAGGGAVDAERLTALARSVDTLLVVVPPRRAPRTVISGPTVDGGGGRVVPVGIVADRGPAALSRFAAAAAAVHARVGTDPGGRGSVAVLAQRSGRYRDLSGRIVRLLGEAAPGRHTFNWTADELRRDDLLEGLGCGLAMALYVGHGRPVGWVGYRGTRAHHFGAQAEPVGAVLSLACLTASRKRTGLSFAEALPLQGAAGACLAAIGPTRHTDNARWALRIVWALSDEPGSIGALVAAAEPASTVARDYRILGDPLAPLADAPTARAAAEDLTRRCALVVDGAAA